MALTALFALIVFVMANVVRAAAFIDCPAVGVCEGTEFPDDMDGTSGYDEMRGREGDDNLNGYGSGDDIFGGIGADILKGGGGGDAIHGSYGDDQIRAASDDEGGDFVDCGPGDDEAWADPTDAVDPDCEVVHYIF